MEPSANLHLRELAKELTHVEYTGIFDESLGTPLFSSNDFGVMGFIDVFFKIRYAKQAIKRLVQEAKGVDKVLLIDAPAFNIPLAKALKKVYPTLEIIYYILPKVWAWKKSRAKKVMKYTDFQLSIFPFETPFYPTSIYVGNPIVDEIPTVKKEVTANNKVAFLAGSRGREIRSLMPIMRKVREQLAVDTAYLVIPPHFDAEKIASLYGDIGRFEVIRDTKQAVLNSEYAFVCSGTATLETAYIGTPFVLMYSTNKYEYKLAKIFMKLPFVGLANLLFWFDNKPSMHKEYLQDEVTVENLLNAYQTDDKEHYFEKVKALRNYLGSNCAKNVADIIKK